MKYFTYFGWLWRQHRKQFVKSLTKPELGHLNSIPFRYVGVGVEMNNLVSHILVQVESLLSLHWTLNVCFVIFFQPPLTSFSELLVLINLLFSLLPTCKSLDQIIFIDISHRLTQPWKGPTGSLSLPFPISTPHIYSKHIHLILATTSFNSFHNLLRARTISL